MKVIIAGSRGIIQPEIVNTAIEQSGLKDKITEVVSGCAVGVDRAGEWWAEKNGIPIKQFPADWHTFGKRAGPIRNQQMANYADALIAIWDGTSRGTADMIAKARNKGLKVYVLNLS